MHLKLAFTATYALSVLGALAAPTKRQAAGDMLCIDSEEVGHCFEIGGTCTTGDGAVGTWNPSGACEATANQPCPAGQVQTETGCTVVDECKDGTVDSNGNCNPSTICTTGQVIVGNACVNVGTPCDCENCETGGGTIDAKGDCQPPTGCSAGQVQTPNGCSATCPEGSTLDENGVCGCKEGEVIGIAGCVKVGLPCNGGTYDSQGNCTPTTECPTDKNVVVDDIACYSLNQACSKESGVGLVVEEGGKLICAMTGEECTTEKNEAGLRGKDPATCIKKNTVGDPCTTAGGNSGVYDDKGMCVASGPCDNGGDCTTVDNKSGKVLDTCQCKPDREEPTPSLPGTVCYSHGDIGIIDVNYRCIVTQGPSGETIIYVPNQPTIIYTPGQATPPAGKAPTLVSGSGTPSRVNGTATRAASTATTRASTAGTTVNFTSPIMAIASIAGVVFGTVFLL